MKTVCYKRLFFKLICYVIFCNIYFSSILAVTGIDFSTSTTYVKKGGKFTLTCQVPGLGVHLWYKDGKPLTPNSINKFHLEQDSPLFSPQEHEYFTRMYLTVESADSVHTGEYKCSVDGLYPQNVIVVTGKEYIHF